MNKGRLTSFLIFGCIFIFAIWVIGNLFHTHPQTASNTTSGTKTSNAQQGNQTTVPWDYKVEQVTVGDLINGDMTISPDNQLLANDNNYATGDKIWTLSYMSATMKMDSTGRTDATLSAWVPVKSYKTEDAAQKDLSNLKDQIETDVNLVGTYKTSEGSQIRDFAVITLPSGNDMKQPISEERYNNFKNKKTVKVTLEEVHSYENYDNSMAKFRGWSE